MASTLPRTRRRSLVKSMVLGAAGSVGLAYPSTRATTAVQSQERKLTIRSVDPSNFPNVRINFNVDTEAGREGKIGHDDVRVIEKIGDEEEIKSCEDFESGGGSADVVFVFDDSGSMREEIETMKDKVQELTDQIEAAEIDARYGLVTFSDADEDLEVDTPFTDAATLRNRVEALEPTEGTRFPERSFSGIEMALGLTFRSDAHKVIINITDVISHYRGDKVSRYDSDYTLEEVATDLRERGVSYFAVSPDYRGEMPIEVETEAGDIITYDETDLERGSVRVLAEQANGTWIDMDSADFGAILDQVVADVQTTYKCSFPTDAPPEEDDDAGTIGLEVDDPGIGKITIEPEDPGAAKLSVPGQVKEAAEVVGPDGEPLARDNIAVFFAEENEQLTSQNTDEQGNVNLDIPIAHTEELVNLIYYQIFDSDPSTTTFETLPPEEVAGRTDGIPDIYTVRQVRASETGGVITIQLPVGHMLDVTVVDEAGTALNDAGVDVFHVNGDAAGGIVAFTDDEGRLALFDGDDAGLEVPSFSAGEGESIRVRVYPPGRERVAEERSLDAVTDSTAITVEV